MDNNQYYFLEIYAPSEGQYGYIYDTLQSLKDGLKKIFLDFMNQTIGDEPLGWTSLNDEVDLSDSYESLKDLVYTFAVNTDFTFRFNNVAIDEKIALGS